MVIIVVVIIGLCRKRGNGVFDHKRSLPPTPEEEKINVHGQTFTKKKKKKKKKKETSKETTDSEKAKQNSIAHA